MEDLMLEITLHLRTNEEVDVAAATLKKLFELRARLPEDPKTHVHIEMPLTAAERPAVSEPVTESLAEPDVTVEPELTPAPAPAPAVTLEQVRARFAALTAAGKAAQAKALVVKFGAAKLTEVAAKHYPALLAEAEQL